MKRNLNSKGFAVSPFLIIALILLGVIITIHFAYIDNTKSKSIAKEGELNKAILDVEEPKTTLQSLALFSAYQAAYDAGQRGDIGDLEDNLIKDIKYDLDEFEGYDNLEIIGDGFIVFIDGSDKYKHEGFIVSATGKKVEDTKSGISSDLSVEKFVGTRIFLLRDLSENLEGEFKKELAPLMQCTLSGVVCSSNGKISCHESNEIKDDENKVPEEFMKDAFIVANKIKDSLLELEIKVAKGKAIEYLKEERVALKFYIEKITVDEITMQTKPYNEGCCEKDKETGECIKYDEDYEVNLKITGEIDINAYLVDYATLKEISSEEFEICAEAPIILENGEIKPLEYNHPFTINYVIDLNYKQDCKPTPVTDSNEEINPNIPEYLPNLESLKYDINSVECKWDSEYVAGKCAGIKTEKPCGCDGGGEPSCAKEGESCTDDCCSGLVCRGNVCITCEDERMRIRSIKDSCSGSCGEETDKKCQGESDYWRCYWNDFVPCFNSCFDEVGREYPSCDDECGPIADSECSKKCSGETCCYWSCYYWGVCEDCDENTNFYNKCFEDCAYHSCLTN